jgi:folate-binding protein YgfZ
MIDSVCVRELSASRARLRLVGRDAKRFLHGMVTNDITGLGPGGGCHAAMLTVKGKLLSDLCVYDLGAEGLLLELPAATAETIRTALDRYLITDDATLSDASAELGELGVYGAGAAAAVQALGADREVASLPPYHFAAAGSLHLAASPELGVPGFHLIGPPEAVAAARAQLVGQGARELSESEATVLRVEAGVPQYGSDLDEERMPSEGRLDDVFSATKGCYLGQEVVVRLRDRGQLNRQLVGLRLPAAEAPPAPGTRLTHPSRPNAGHLTSVVRSPRLGVIALGYVHRSVWEPGTELQLCTAEGEPLGLSAVVSPLPFPA